jgi:phage tail protein X
MYNIAQGVQSSKEVLESSQSKTQALFDQRRRTVGTGLNVSTIQLENSKAVAEESKFATSAYVNEVKADNKTVLHRNIIRAEEAKLTSQEYESNLARTINDLKTDDTTILHRRNIRTEGAKLSAQLAESQVTKVVEEFKSGEMTNPAMSPALQTVMQQMQEDNARIAAVRQGTTSAQYVQQSYISGLMDESAVGPLATEVLQTAAGVDPNGRTRARANAISQLTKLQNEALTNNVTLLNDKAEKESTTLNALSKLTFQRHTGIDLPAGEVQSAQDPSIIEASMEALARAGDISTLRKARMNPAIDQAMMTRVFARNDGTMKAKGGFDLQANPGLANASRETMDVSIAGTLGDIAAANIAGQKAGWWSELAGDLPRIFNNVESFTYDPDPIKNAEKRGKQKGLLEQTYHNLTTALTSPEVLKDIGDRMEPTIKMHEILREKFGEPSVEVDYNLARVGKVKES